MSSHEADVVIVGGGLAGCALAALLSLSNIRVVVIEKRCDPKTREHASKRSINLTLAARGLRLLQELKVDERVADLSVPLVGRQVHLADRSLPVQTYDLLSGDAIHSISRQALHLLLRDCAINNGATCLFDADCIAIDFQKRAVTYSHCGAIDECKYKILVGADGANSFTRSIMARDYGVTFAKLRSIYGYKEANIKHSNGLRLNRSALHVWPSQAGLIVALPNTNGTFTATIIMRHEGEWSFNRFVTPNSVGELFESQFPDFIELIPRIVDEFIGQPTADIFTVQVDRWLVPGAILIGDSAHAMEPFYGQGMNAALESCLALALALRSTSKRGWDELLAEFEGARRPDIEAMATLSRENRDDLNRQHWDSSLALKRSVETQLQKLFPQYFLPLYAMISFTRLPYAEAVRRHHVQSAIVDELLAGGHIFDVSKARQLIYSRLSVIEAAAHGPSLFMLPSSNHVLSRVS